MGKENPKCDESPETSANGSISRDAVEFAIDLSKEHARGSWEQLLSIRGGRIQGWNAETIFKDISSNHPEPIPAKVRRG